MGNFNHMWRNALSLALGLLCVQFGPLTAPASADTAPENMHYSYQGHEINHSQFEALQLFNKSIPLMRAGNYADAEELLRKALELDPDCYQALTNLGFVLGRLGHGQEGIDALQKALKLQPDKPEAVCTLGAMYQADGRLADAIQMYSDFVHAFPKHAMTPNVVALIKLLQSEYDKELAVKKATPADQLASDYFPFATYDAVTKWTPEHFPLKVYIPTDAEAASVPQYRDEFGEALRNSFKQWQEKSNAAVTFDYVDSPKKADIDCLWTDDPTRVSRPSEGGEARVQYDAMRGIGHVQIIILTKSIDGSQNNLPLNMVRFACLHEIGHSLGITGHSPDPGDIMFCSVPAQDKLPDLTARDGTTLAHLYRPDVKLAYHFHEGPGTDNDKVALNNEGVNFCTTQDYAKAAERFEAALKIDSNYEPSRRNLAACLNNIGISLAKDGKFDDAERKLKRALDLEASDTDRQKKASTMKNYAYVLFKLNHKKEAQQMEANANKLLSDGSVTAIKSK